MKPLLTDLLGKITFITGAGKNVGKTTFLNYALANLRGQAQVLITSVGVDGEATDLVFGNRKPLIKVEAGDLVLTSELAINAATALLRIREVFSQSTVFGKVVFAEVERSGEVELMGPDTNKQLAEILKVLVASGTVKTVLVDGAINRVTQVGIAAGFGACGVVDVIKVTPENKVQVLARIDFLNWVRGLDERPIVASGPSCYYLEGALTASKLQQLSSAVRELIIDDYSCIFVEHKLLQKRDLQVYFKNLIPVRGVVLVFQNTNEEHFYAEVAVPNWRDWVVTNPYQMQGSLT